MPRFVREQLSTVAFIGFVLPLLLIVPTNAETATLFCLLGIFVSGMAFVGQAHSLRRPSQSRILKLAAWTWVLPRFALLIAAPLAATLLSIAMLGTSMMSKTDAVLGASLDAESASDDPAEVTLGGAFLGVEATLTEKVKSVLESLVAELPGLEKNGTALRGEDLTNEYYALVQAQIPDPAKLRTLILNPDADADSDAGPRTVGGYPAPANTRTAFFYIDLPLTDLNVTRTRKALLGRVFEALRRGKLAAALEQRPELQLASGDGEEKKLRELGRRLEKGGGKQDRAFRELTDSLTGLTEMISAETTVVFGYSAFRFNKLINGGIQHITIWVFWVGVFLTCLAFARLPTISARTDRLVNKILGEDGVFYHWSEPSGGSGEQVAGESPGLRTDRGLLQKLYEEEEKIEARRHIPSDRFTISLRVLRTANIQGSQEAMRDTLDKNCEDVRARNERDLEFCRYIAWLIPSIGFVGTIVGIGQALLRSERMVNAATEEQGAEIGKVTDTLGLAFDTTLVALVLSILIMLLLHWAQFLGETRVSALARFCTERVVERFRKSQHSE